MDDATRLLRWRLILGAESRQSLERLGGCEPQGEAARMDQALDAIYRQDAAAAAENGRAGAAGGRGRRGAGRGMSTPQLVRWLDDIRSLFSRDIVVILQEDAVERCGLRQLLLEPELLDELEADVALASTLLDLREQVPERAREHVRAFIRRIVEEINRLLADDIRRAVAAALDRRRHSPVPSAAALDYRTTIARGLKNYQPELGVIIPERFYFFARSHIAAHRRTVILDIDQSGSMSESIIHVSVMASVLASMATLKTHVVAFDTSVVDLTNRCGDPVELLFGFQLGGGTDIERSLAYCRKLVEQPSRTLLFLISDLDEGGNQAGMLRRLEEFQRSGVTVICLLAVANGGKPHYNARLAKRVAALGIPCLACQPDRLPQLLEAALCGRNLSALYGAKMTVC